MRADLLEGVVSQVNSFEKGPPSGYEHGSVRRRLIFESLNQGVQYVFNNAVEGDIAEFGTASGFSAFTIARAMAIYRKMYAERLIRLGIPQKVLHLFDSFQGLPRPEHALDLQSPNVRSGIWQQGTYTALTREELLALCTAAYDPDKILAYAGWFTEMLPVIPSSTKFAMLHLDCDLYSSTIEVLDFVFSHDRVAEGCVIFFDDWNTNRASPPLGQRRAWKETVEKHGIEFSDCGDYAVLGRKFIYHAL